MRFVLDEDVNPKVAESAWKVGLDVTSVHDIGRRGLSDFEQLQRAAEEGRIFVTRNREDYVYWTAECYRAGDAHAGVLLLARGLPNERPEAIANALKRWTYAHAGAEADGPGFGRYHIEFIAR